MDSRKRQKLSLLPLKLSAVVFGTVTLLECAAAVYTAIQRMRHESYASSSFSMMGKIGGVSFHLPGFAVSVIFGVICALPPLFTAAALISLHRRKNRGRRS